MSSTPLSSIDFKKVSIKTPTIIVDEKFIDLPFTTGNSQMMRFSRIAYPSKSPVFTASGEVSTIGFSNEEYGGQCYVSVKLSNDDATALESLEQSFLEESIHYQRTVRTTGYESGVYAFVATVKEGIVKFKLPEVAGKLKAVTKYKNAAALVKTVNEGCKVVVSFTPGFYFNDDNYTFGMYNTVKALVKV